MVKPISVNVGMLSWHVKDFPFAIFAAASALASSPSLNHLVITYFVPLVTGLPACKVLSL